MSSRKFALLAVMLCAMALFVAPMADEAREFAIPSEFSAAGASAETLGVIALGPGAMEIGVGDARQLDYSVDGVPAALGVTWTSSDPAVATVGPGGLVTAVSEGACLMRGVSFSGDEAEAVVRVYPAPSVLIVSPASVRLGVGESYTMSPVISAGSRASYAFKSSNAAVAGVDVSGTVRARKAGSVTVTVSTHNGKKDTLRVIVAKAPTYVRFKADALVAYVGESVATSAELSGGAGAVVRYSSSDPSVARVDSRGRVTGVSAGEAVIEATTYNGKSDRCAVVVYDPPARIVAPQKIDAVAGVPMDFSVRAETEMGGVYAGYIDVDCADPDIACVKDGVLYPLKRGETYVTLTAHRVSFSVAVSVVRYGDAYATLIAAHRGGSGNGTENTLPAIRGAVADGADAIEVDVRETEDGALVLMHDASIKRTSNSTGYVSRMTLAQLRSVNFNGDSICTLDEALSYLSGTSASLLLEMKTAGIEEACVEAVKRAGMAGRVTFTSFSLNALSAVRAADPDASIGYLYVVGLKDPAGFAKMYGIDLMLPFVNLIDEVYVSGLHNAGVRVGVWTVNKLSNFRVARHAGADYIITDRVSSALAAVGR